MREYRIPTEGESGSTKTVVITGASSGIGRAAAVEFGRRGHNVVLAARRRHLLAEAAREVEAAGGRALVVPTDVTDPASVEKLARQTYHYFNGLDIWVNNATAAMYGEFEKIPPHVFRRVIEVNIFGYVNGIRATLPYFRRQGRGVIINVGSVLSKMTVPYMSAYSAAKHAVIGLGDTLRQELRGTNIHVCTVMPGSTDTPFYQHAANFTGRVPQPMPPVAAPETVARIIVETAEKPRKETFAPRNQVAFGYSRTLFPQLSEKMGSQLMERFTFRDEPAEDSEGNLFEPSADDLGASGGWRKRMVMEKALPIGVPVIAAAIALPILALFIRQRVRNRYTAGYAEAA